MSILIPETDLPQELTAEQAVEAPFIAELAEAASWCGQVNVRHRLLHFCTTSIGSIKLGC
jgi:hypothetical protein